MSNADTRAAIAAALNTVDGIRGFASKPPSVKAGNAWPNWSGGTRDAESMGYYETWRITVVTDQHTDADADGFVDTYAPGLLAALSTLMFVDTYAPARLDTETGQLYALVITGRTE